MPAGRNPWRFHLSTSTAVRVAMLAAGFAVARGRGMGEKAETTIALTPGVPSRHALLGADWLGRWSRSHARFPAGLPEEERGEFARRIEALPQFSGAAG